MARKQARTGRKPWTPDPEDAIRLAALRWFSLSLERLAIELYATDKAKYSSMETVLRTALRDMKKLEGGTLQDEEECPPGYVLCKDGICAPMCDPDPS